MDSYTTPAGVTVAVGQLWTDDVYRQDARTIRVLEIAEPHTDYKGALRCTVTYQVVADADGPRALTRTKTIDAARLTDPRLYRLVEEVAR
ncbi:hypothetical protein REK76_29430 (plasmid) [Nocardia farcinica]|uniref:hypothetical protein n=1 Tax=Nocardia farcinica TaxID=37329 RepID=UPI0018962385|nr:hypothetical protein [Nocardia farcinica]MBF6284479.1 hypothetical protein [Nocardia farcinica]